MSAFQLYKDKVKKHLKRSFGYNENPPVVERILSSEEVKPLFLKGYHPKRTAEFILDKAQKETAQKDITMNEQNTNNELTLLHFIADMIRCSESEYHYETHWLCTRSDIQDDALKIAQRRYEAWKEKELAHLAAREDVRRDGPYSKI